MSDTNNLEYNSQRDLLEIPEYGRHIQKLISYAAKIEDKEKRQAYTQEIVNVMAQTDSENDKDNEEKLWKHAVKISNMELDVTLPNGEEITKDSLVLNPEKPAYPANQKKYRHYGNFIKVLIQKASKEEDEDKKEELSLLIASYMKMAYINWHSNQNVNDESIKADLRAISDGELTVDKNQDLDYFKKTRAKRKSRNNRRGRKSNRRRGRRGRN